MTSSAILTVTLNPAIDMTTAVCRLAPQIKLRCGPAVLHAGGGGANVSRAILALGGSSRAFVALAGHAGHHYAELLRAAGVDPILFALDGETRTSLTVMEEETGRHYRFVLPGPVQPAIRDEEILAELSRVLANGVGYVVASGGLPPGIDEDFYARLADLVRWHGGRLILDTHGTALRRALAGRPYLIRLNEIEARELTDLAAPAATPAELASRLVADGAAEIVVFAMGEQGSLVTSADAQFTIAPPQVAVRSMVGAGDSYVAALTLALSRGWPLVDANRYGVAAAASAVTREATELCARDSTERFYNQTGEPRAIAQPQRAAAG